MKTLAVRTSCTSSTPAGLEAARGLICKRSKPYLLRRKRDRRQSKFGSLASGALARALVSECAAVATQTRQCNDLCVRRGDNSMYACQGGNRARVVSWKLFRKFYDAVEI